MDERERRKKMILTRTDSPRNPGERERGVHNNLNAARVREEGAYMRERRGYLSSHAVCIYIRERAALTCPCCFVIRLLLDCFPSIGSCCCNHSSVSLQQKIRAEY